MTFLSHIPINSGSRVTINIKFFNDNYQRKRGGERGEIDLEYLKNLFQYFYIRILRWMMVVPPCPAIIRIIFINAVFYKMIKVLNILLKS